MTTAEIAEICAALNELIADVVALRSEVKAASEDLHGTCQNEATGGRQAVAA